MQIMNIVCSKENSILDNLGKSYINNAKTIKEAMLEGKSNKEAIKPPLQVITPIYHPHL